MAKKTEAGSEETTAVEVPAWDTPVKLGAIDEALYVEEGDVVVKVDRSCGEI